MQDFLPGARALVDLAIAITLCELAVLSLLHWRNGRGVAPRDLLPSIAAGLCLMAALRAGLTGAGWSWVAAGLLAAGVAHALDLRRRWRRSWPGLVAAQRAINLFDDGAPFTTPTRRPTTASSAWPPWSASSLPNSPRRCLGEHSPAVLREAGLNDREIDALIAAGAALQAPTCEDPA